MESPQGRAHEGTSSVFAHCGYWRYLLKELNLGMLAPGEVACYVCETLQVLFFQLASNALLGLIRDPAFLRWQEPRSCP